MMFNLKSIKVITVISFLIFNFVFCFTLVRAYSIGDPTDSFFNQNPLQFSPIDITKFIKKGDPSILTLGELINTKSFSSDDIGSSAKAVLALFIRLIITTLNVALGIFQVLLWLLTSQFN